METNACHLDHAAGRERPCVRAECPLWHEDNCVVASASPDFVRNTSLVGFLRDIRSELERLEPRRAVRAFQPPGLV